MEIQNSYLEQYLKNNTLFTRTLAIKFNEEAALLNEGIILEYGAGSVDLNEPTTWKYYLNLSGKYHPTDTVMTVTSIDTLEEIDFTPENLRVHTATAKAYVHGTREYEALVYKYPKNIALIRGILNPCDINTAIAAENGTILSYQKNLIESQEATLILELEEYIKSVFYRWFNAQFAMSDNLYCSDYLAQLYLSITPKLLNLRLKRCGTIEVHSFHIRMMLASHVGMDRYLPYLSLKQALWLYRNVRFLERNPGKVSQFLKLVDKVLKERNIPIGEYSIRQLDDFTDYRPKLQARLKTISTDTNSGSVSLIDVDVLHAKERTLEDANVPFYDEKEESVDFSLKTSSSGVIQTKLLESSMIDYTNAVPDTFEDVAIREWCSLANNDLFTPLINFKDPKTSEQRTLKAKDAFFYMLYVASGADGFLFTDFPSYHNLRQRKPGRPTPESLLSLVPTKEIDLTDVAEALVANQPYLSPIFSVTRFNSYVTTIYEQAYWQWFLVSSFHEPYSRGLVENMVNGLYESQCKKIDLGSATIQDWLTFNNLPGYDYSREEALALIKNIYEASVGVTVDDTKKLKNIQQQLISLVCELSSYTIRVITEINESDLILLNWAATRVSNLGESTTSHCDIHSALTTFGISAKSADSAELDTESVIQAAPKQSAIAFRSLVNLEIASEKELSMDAETLTRLSLSRPDMSITYTGQDVSLEESVGIPGYTSFYRMSVDAQLTLKSKYQ